MDEMGLRQSHPAGLAVPLIPVLQLQAKDVPDVAFHPGANVMQVLWCPMNHGDPVYVAKPFVFWREDSETRGAPERDITPHPADSSYLPTQCVLDPEAVVEYPTFPDLPSHLQQKVIEWGEAQIAAGAVAECAEDLYEQIGIVAPGSKVGGYCRWIQRAERPRCACGAMMAHLLTLADYEFTDAAYERWCPLEDREDYTRAVETNDFGRIVEIQQAVGFNLGAGSLMLFVCRSCAHWPIALVYQC
jgi:hypothetical protein